MNGRDDGEGHWFQTDRRARNTFRDWSVIATLLLNLAGGVWIAARWNYAIEQLQVSNQATSKTLAEYGAAMADLSTKQALLIYQVRQLENQAGHK